MVAAFEPMDLHGRRQLVAFDLLPVPEEIASSLDNQRRGLDRLEMLDP
jgi:hypothetical protein